MVTDFVEKFKRYLKEGGKSPQTIESYVGDIDGFVAYIQLKPKVVEVIEEYLAERAENQFSAS